MCFPEETHFRDTERLKTKEWKNLFHENHKRKRVRVAKCMSCKLRINWTLGKSIISALMKVQEKKHLHVKKSYKIKVYLVDSLSNIKSVFLGVEDSHLHKCRVLDVTWRFLNFFFFFYKSCTAFLMYCWFHNCALRAQGKHCCSLPVPSSHYSVCSWL